MPQRFVILEHDHEGLHFDLMLEKDGMLKTWRLPSPLELGMVTSATQSFDHRLLYLDYEGPISNNRGVVRRWDVGTFEGSLDDANKIAVQLHGIRCTGQLHLERRFEIEWVARLVPIP